jgi:hypothetical protein
LLKDIEERGVAWRDTLTERGLDNNAANNEICSFLDHVLTQAEEKIKHHSENDIGKVKNPAEAAERTLVVTVAREKIQQ